MHLIQRLNNKAYVGVESVTTFNEGRRGSVTLTASRPLRHAYFICALFRYEFL